LPEFSEHEKTRVGEEMTDCLAYLFRLADQCEIGRDLRWVIGYLIWFLWNGLRSHISCVAETGVECLEISSW